MNKAQMIELLETGAYFDSKESKFFHPSFRKGFRKITYSDISWQSVNREHGIFGTNRLVSNNGVYKLA